jgi:EAL domain-containing protein (putative c-di-GMP-specific phosphodiesterase class I)
VARTLERHAIPPGCLELEITKSCVMTDARESIERITQGCTQIQGHYFCPPLPARGCSHFLATRPRLALD